jgi:hypothetical protein
MIAVISFICRPSVLLPAPAHPQRRGLALTSYQEAGQLPGDGLRRWKKWFFWQKQAANDSKTGSVICLKNTQKTVFACFLSEIEARF